MLYELQLDRDPNAVASGNTGQALIDEILLERRKELYGEVGVGYLEPVLGAGVQTLPDRPAIIGWKARCEVHELFNVEDISNVRKQFPETSVIAHPECSPEVVAASIPYIMIWP